MSTRSTALVSEARFAFTSDSLPQASSASDRALSINQALIGAITRTAWFQVGVERPGALLHIATNDFNTGRRPFRNLDLFWNDWRYVPKRRCAKAQKPAFNVYGINLDIDMLDVRPAR